MVQIGTQKIEISKDAQLWFQGSHAFALIELDKDGKPKRIIGKSDDNGKANFVSRADFTLEVRTEPKSLWTLDAFPVMSDKEPYDPIPVEIAEEEPLTLHEQIRTLVGQMAIERYGKSQVDTIEEALNFDVDGDGKIGLSGYEVVEEEQLELMPEAVVDVDPETTTEPVVPEAPTVPKETEPVVKQPPPT